MPVTSEKLNAVGGLSVGIPPIDVISETGNITAPVATIGNVVAGQGVFGNITVSGNITADNIISNIVGNITGNIRVPGADTQLLFNIGGNISTSANLTFNPVTNFLEVEGNLCVANVACANFFSGDGSNLTNVQAITANTATNNLQPNIYQLPNIQDISVSNSANFTSNSVVHVYGGNSGDILVTDGSGNLSWKVGSHAIANGTSSVSIPTSGGQVEFRVSNAHLMTVGNAGNVTIETELWVSGNVRGNYFDGNGSRLTDINAANISGTLPNIATSGNILLGNTTMGTATVTASGSATLFSAPATMSAAMFGIVGTELANASNRTFLNMSVVTDGTTVNVDRYGRVDIGGSGANLTGSDAAISGGNLEIIGYPETANPTKWTITYTVII